MNSKAIKRQLLAAIAMVLVAALALGSSTYAWFVSNNKVTATTTSISAQSNAPFLKIDLESITTASGTSKAYTTPSDATALYPAQVSYSSNTEKWESAYATAATTHTEKTGTRFTVGTDGSHTQATANKYAFMQSFVIGTDSETNGSFKNLVVDSITVTGTDSATGTDADKQQIKSALRVLFVCGNNHFVYAPGNDGNWAPVDKYTDNTHTTGNTTATDGKYVLKNSIPAKGTDNATVNIYLFYDGSQNAIYSNNLPNLGAASISVNFSAEAFDPNNTTVDPGTQIDTTT